jgi:hypothetical protein
MLKKPSSLKEWTEVLTAWLQVLGLFAAGIFALIEYQGQKYASKVQRSVEYLAKADSEVLTEARVKISQNEQAKFPRLQKILLDKALTQDETNTAYFQFVVDELVRYNEEPGLKTEFSLLLGFLDQGVICSQEGLCDEATIRSSLSDFGKNFVRTYTPYLCYLRRAWNDPSVGRRVEKFYNPTAADTACSDFYQSIKRASKTRRAEGTDVENATLGAEPPLRADRRATVRR